jgi:hypothetical protein
LAQGFDSKGDVVVSSVAGRKLTWEEIGRRSAKVIGFTDLAGHEKYREFKAPEGETTAR